MPNNKLLTPKQRAKIIDRTSIVDTVINLFIGIVKVIIAFFSGSLAIASDSILNFGDTVGGIITIFGIHFSTHKPTKRHPYGFGRVEYLTAILTAILMIMISSFFAHIAIEHIMKPVETHVTVFQFVALFFLVLLKYYLYFFNKREYKKTDSGPLEATAHDSIIDAFGTTITGLLVLLDHFIKLNLDGWISLLVAITLIISSSIDIFKTISIMLGVSVNKNLITDISNTVKKIKPVIDVRNIMVHSYGYEVHYGEMSLILPDNLDTIEISQLLKKIEILLQNEYNITFFFEILAQSYKSTNKSIDDSKLSGAKKTTINEKKNKV